MRMPSESSKRSGALDMFLVRTKRGFSKFRQELAEMNRWFRLVTLTLNLLQGTETDTGF